MLSFNQGFMMIDWLWGEIVDKMYLKKIKFDLVDSVRYLSLIWWYGPPISLGFYFILLELLYCIFFLSDLLKCLPKS